MLGEELSDELVQKQSTFKMCSMNWNLAHVATYLTILDVSHTHLCSSVTGIEGHSWNQDCEYPAACDIPDPPEECEVSIAELVISDPPEEAHDSPPLPFAPGLIRVTSTVIPSYSRWFVHVGSMRKHRPTNACPRVHLQCTQMHIVCCTFSDACLTMPNRLSQLPSTLKPRRRQLSYRQDRSRLVRLHAAK